MSNYIIIPNSITRLTERCKQEEALVYATIRNEIKDETLKASYSEAALAELFYTTERTMNTYISNLKKAGLLTVTEKKQGDSEYPYNVYQFEKLTEDYFMLLPQFLYDNNISPKLKGLLLFIKANCWSGTNFIRFKGITTDLAEKLKVGKNNIKSYLEELKTKGYIRFIDKSLHITNPNFPLSINNDLDNTTYEIIYDYCLSKDRIPPIKNVDERGKDKALSFIVGEYQNENDRRDRTQQDQFDFGRLRNALNERCKVLPPNLTMEYFCQALVNKLPSKHNKQYSDIII